MITYLRNIRHSKFLKNFFIWSVLGSFFRFFIKLIPLNFSVIQNIYGKNSFRFHARFAFSDFKSWGNKHNEFFPIYLHLSKKIKCFFDIGAHIGIVSLPIAKNILKGGKVYSFEASSQNVKMLRYHIKVNHLLNIEIVNKLVSSSNLKNNQFYESSSPSGMHSIIPIKSKKIIQHKSIESITIDYFCERNKLSPEIIKVDIEGAEIEMLKGARKTIRKSKPLIFLSYHPTHIKNLGYKKNIIFKILKEFEYMILDSNGNKPLNLINAEYLLIPKDVKPDEIFSKIKT